MLLDAGSVKTHVVGDAAVPAPFDANRGRLSNGAPGHFQLEPRHYTVTCGRIARYTTGGLRIA